MRATRESNAEKERRHKMEKSKIGVIGLAVMGENLVMNMESKGFRVSVYNRTTEKVTHFLQGRARGRQIQGAYSLGELVGQLESQKNFPDGQGRAAGGRARGAAFAAVRRRGHFD